MNIIILGAPGAGKGTQGELLSQNLKLPRVSAGAVLRRVWSEGGEKGKAIGQYILKGRNVPAALLFQVLEPWFAGHPEGFIADNLPRNVDQLEEFKKFLRKTNIKIDKVIHLVVSPAESLRRIGRRYEERLKAGEARPDECPEVVKTRLKEGYQKEIRPILDYFKQMGVLVEINGEQTVEKVQQQILESLKP